MDWAGLKKEYITTDISQRALAKKYNVSETAIRRRSVREGWVAAREQMSGKTTAKIVEKASDRAAEARDIIYNAALDMARQMAGLVKDGVYPTGWKPRDVSGALKDCRELLEIRSQDDIEEQRARIAKLKKEVDEAKEEGKTITVKIEGASETWTR